MAVIIVSQGPIVRAVGADGGVWTFFSLVCHFTFLSLSLGDGLILTDILSQRAVKPKQPTHQYVWDINGTLIQL